MNEIIGMKAYLLMPTLAKSEVPTCSEVCMAGSQTKGRERNHSEEQNHPSSTVVANQGGHVCIQQSTVKRSHMPVKCNI